MQRCDQAAGPFHSSGHLASFPWRPLPLLVAGLLACWALVLAVELWARPILPVGETRLLSVAWEMWRSGDFVVPRLNGEPYADKGPMFCWLVHAGWLAWGVNAWSPRLVAPLAALAAVLLTARLGRALWPGAGVAVLAGVLLAGMAYWSLFSTLSYVDPLLALCVVASQCATWSVWRHGSRTGWLLGVVAVAAGLLTKGPVILVHVLPVALAARWWGGPAPARRGLALAGMLALALALGAIWAAAAVGRVGTSFLDEVLHGQTLERLVDTSEHPQPWWWLLSLLPVLVLPWALWPPLWRGVARGGGLARDPGLRLCVVWMAGTLATLSAISGKQLHYLMPMLPAVALAGARVAALAPPRRRDAWPLGCALLLTGVAAAVLSAAPPPALSAALPTPALPWLALLPLGSALILARPARHLGGAAAMLVGVLGLGLVAHVAAGPALAAYDTSVMAGRIADCQQAGRDVAFIDKYRGEYTFTGLLPRPLLVVPRAAVLGWSARHPRGVVVGHFRDQPPRGLPRPDSERPYRGARVGLWRASSLTPRAASLPDSAGAR